MPTPGIGGGRLAAVAAAHKKQQATRKLLNLSERGIQKAPVGPPAVAPAQPPAPASQAAPGAAAAAPPPASNRPARLAKVQGFLDSMQAGAQMPGPENALQPEGTPEPTMLEPALRAASALNEPPETQIMRVLGRPGSPREVALFTMRLQLERELNRPPTINEITQRLLGGGIPSPSFPVAFEIPQQGQ